MDVFDALARARARGQRVVLVTVLAVDGDAPSRPGAKLVVGEDGVLAGTLGCAEFDTAGVELAGDALLRPAPLRRRELFGDQHHPPGTRAPVHNEPRALELFAEVQEPEPALLVFSSTPVGRAVAELAGILGRRAVLVAPGGDTAVASGVQVKADDPVRFLLAAAPGPADAVVLTDHDAPYVDEVLRVALASEAFYVGILGNRRYPPGALTRLRESGVPPAHLARLRSPVGLDIGSRSPEEIALSVVAEVIAVERGRDGGSLRIDWAKAGR